MKTLVSFKMFWIHKLLLYTELFFSISLYIQILGWKKKLPWYKKWKVHTLKYIEYFFVSWIWGNIFKAFRVFLPNASLVIQLILEKNLYLNFIHIFLSLFWNKKTYFCSGWLIHLSVKKKRLNKVDTRTIKY